MTQPGRAQRVSAWFASPAASPLFIAVAVATAIGWAVGTAMLVAAIVTGRPVLPAVAVGMAWLVAGAANAALGIGALAARSNGTVPPGAAMAARAMRREQRRAIRARSGLSASARLRRLVRPHRRPHRRALASLPRPVAWIYQAATWLTIGIGLFALVPGMADGQQGEAVWMATMLAWSAIACRRLDRIRAGAAIVPLIGTGSVAANGARGPRRTRT
jgi:hypothetical protein